MFFEVANASPFFRRLFLKWMAVQYTSENEGLLSNCMKTFPQTAQFCRNCEWDLGLVVGRPRPDFGINSEFQQNQIKLQLTSSHFGPNGQ